jgi:hypothetical protein
LRDFTVAELGKEFQVDQLLDLIGQALQRNGELIAGLAAFQLLPWQGLMIGQLERERFRTFSIPEISGQLIPDYRPQPRSKRTTQLVIVSHDFEKNAGGHLLGKFGITHPRKHEAAHALDVAAEELIQLPTMPIIAHDPSPLDRSINRDPQEAISLQHFSSSIA